MTVPLISVIIPTYNRLDLLKQSINTVRNQTFKNYEVIVTDNNSSDGTGAWLAKFCKKYKRFRYVTHKVNLGMVGNWNSGIPMAKGKYIAMLMDDDLWNENYLKEMVAGIKADESVGMAVCQVIPFGECSDEIPGDFYKIYKSSKTYRGIECIKKYLVGDWLVGLPSAVLVKREIFSEFGLFSNEGLDQEMWLRACQKYDFRYVNKKLCYWRIPSTNSFTSTSDDSISLYRQVKTLKKITGYDYNQEISKEINKYASKLEIKLRRIIVYKSLHRSKFKTLYLIFWSPTSYYIDMLVNLQIPIKEIYWKLKIISNRILAFFISKLRK